LEVFLTTFPITSKFLSSILKVEKAVVNVIIKYDEDCCRIYFYGNASDVKSVVVTDAETGNGVLNMLVHIIHKKYNIEEIDDVERFSTNIEQYKLYCESISRAYIDTIGAITIN
jgi:hypothetical protein